MKQPIYLDYNATTPLAPEVIKEMLPYMKDHFGNPSSSHPFGTKAKEAVEVARTRVAELLNCGPEEIIFTSGGTESNNHALKGVAEANKHRGNHIITSTIEHPAIIEPCLYLMGQGFDVSFVNVDKYGRVNLKELEKAISPDTILVSIMHANNEVGTIEPIREISEMLKGTEVIFHTDAAQSVGKIETDVKKLGVDLLSLAGHKLYAPKGIGVLYVKQGIPLNNIIHGAGQEQGRRPGTENVLEIVGLGKACELARDNLTNNVQKMKETRDLMEKLLLESFPGARVNGHLELRLPNTLSISFPDIEADKVLGRLRNVACSAGAACHSDGVKISHVLAAMDVPEEYAKGTLRISTGRFTTQENIMIAAKELVGVIKSLR